MQSPRFHTFIMVITIFLTAFTTLNAKTNQLEFFPNGTYDPAIPSPNEIIGLNIGDKPISYQQTVHYLKALANSTDKVKLVEAGESHEGRTLYYLLISSAENMAALETIQENISHLADPRMVKSEAAARDIIRTSPVIIWMMYSIHGNELSGTDAGIQLAYQLAAGTDEITKNILNNAVIGIDPQENPDGRARTLAHLQQWRGQVATTDAQSLYHRGFWPYGRTNHYLFDLNRDWIILSQPETRARVRALTRWNPQLVVDAHEMGSYDTYLFNPPREPINPNVPSSIKKWWKIFAADQAHAFDQFGWSYYTREWLEEWYPGYGSAWPYYHGAIAILYEQARTAGGAVKRPEGTTLTFRESVQHQFVSSITNIKTAVEHREDLLTDFYAIKKQAVSTKEKKIQAYVITAEKNPSRALDLVERLTAQGIEVVEADEAFKLSNAADMFGKKHSNISFPEGTYIISVAQPAGRLVQAILDFDTRMNTNFLKSERESLEKGKGTRMYEVSAWSLPLAWNVPTFTSSDAPKCQHHLFKPQQFSATGLVIQPDAEYGFLIHYDDDASVHALVELLNQDLMVRCATEPFTIERQNYERGSLLLRRHENPSNLIDILKSTAQSCNVSIYGVQTALSEKGSDLGARKFRLLQKPKIAILAGDGISGNSFGSLWYLLDMELKINHTILNITNFSRTDLRKYNVLIMPSNWGGPDIYKKLLTEKDRKKLKSWVANGGTVVAIGSAAAFLADSSVSLSRVKLKRQVLTQLKMFQQALELEQLAGKTAVDSLEIWESNTKRQTPADEEGKKHPSVDRKILVEQDKQQRLFMPRGAILNVALDREHWLSFGETANVPAIVYSSYAFMSAKPVQTAGRFASADKLRISGLLWPESRDRWQNTAFLTREAFGNGQFILFSAEPFFRAYFYGTGRLFINSLLLGPGLGTRSVVDF